MIFTLNRPALRLLLSGALVVGAAVAQGQGGPDYEQPPVSYSTTTPKDAVSRLQERMKLAGLNVHGRDKRAVQTLLDALDVPVETQVLVFSRTSLQRGRIRPEQPRALYFSDSVYVGWVPGGLAEIVAIDPQLGPVFYSFDFADAKAAPAIVRDADCMRCHGGTFVRDIPGLLARSVFPDDRGDPLGRFGSRMVDDETPFGERWGGWYVTGYHGTEPHRGNTLGAEDGERLVFNPSGKRPDELSDFFDPAPYLRATSDVAALLVIEHQMAMQNTLTRSAFATRRMMAYQHGLQKSFKEPETDEPAFDSVRSVLASAAQDIVDRLLFRDAAVLPEGIDGDASFRRRFAEGAPRSRAGHALKDLDLNGKIFAQRCSYLIYSESFLAMPEVLKSRVFDLLGSALSGGEASGRYAYLPVDEKRRIREILLETHPEAARRWAADGTVGPAGVSAL